MGWIFLRTEYPALFYVTFHLIVTHDKSKDKICYFCIEFVAHGKMIIGFSDSRKPSQVWRRDSYTHTHGKVAMSFSCSRIRENVRYSFEGSIPNSGLGFSSSWNRFKLSRVRENPRAYALGKWSVRLPLKYPGFRPLCSTTVALPIILI